MAVKSGDRIVMRASPKRLDPGSRGGVIEEVLNPDQPRYRVRWDDGRETVIAPVGDTVTIEPQTAKSKKKG